MAKSEPKNEQILCERVAAHLAACAADKVVKVEAVDSIVRDRPAVEAIYHTKNKSRFAVEHTRIESFPQQILEGKRFAQFFDPLLAELEGVLPGVFLLSADVGAVKVPSGDHAKVRKALSTWIQENAPKLEPEERVGWKGNCEITATPAGVPFAVSLRRDCDYDSQMFALQGLVGDRQEQRRAAIERSLTNKCPKLKAAKVDGCVSVLILESDDISLANRVVVAESVMAELGKRNDQPDVVIWARTSTRPWMGGWIKDFDVLYPKTDPTFFNLNG